MTDRQMRHMLSHIEDPHEIFFSAPGSLLWGELSAVQWRLLINRIVDLPYQPEAAGDFDL